MTNWIWTEFVPENRTCGEKAFECDLDWEEEDIMAACAQRVADLTARFGPAAQGHAYTDMGPFADDAYDLHAWFFNLEEHYTHYNKRFEFRDDRMQQVLQYGIVDAMTFTVFFRQAVTRQDFGLDLA